MTAATQGALPTLPPKSDPIRQALERMAAKPGGMRRSEIRDFFNVERRERALVVFDAMQAHGLLVFLREGRSMRYFMGAECAQRFLDTPTAVPARFGSGLGDFPVPVEERANRRNAMSFRAVDTDVRRDGVKVSTCPAIRHDPRFQVEPGAKVFGAGFAAAGPGVDIDTGKGWA